MGKMLGQRLAERAGWLDGVADAVQAPLRDALKRALPLRDALDGTWLGTPLHPALTDVPVGASTTALLLDAAHGLRGSRDLAVAADRALAVGVLGTLPAALTGLSDWRDLRGESRRVGGVHAALNVAALALNASSLALRAGGARGAGKLASAAAFALTSAAAHVGGELSFGLGVRVNRTAWPSGPEEFERVAGEEEVRPEELLRVEAGGAAVLLTRSAAGRLCAIAATCSHLGGPLDEGSREGDTVVCPWHGSRFDLCSGEVLTGPAVFAQPRYEARVRDGGVEVRRAGG